jgi:hypothetical protein
MTISFHPEAETKFLGGSLKMITVRSKIEKGSVRLPKRVNLPDGTQVIVRIEPIQKAKEKQKIITELSGAWSGDPTIKSVFRK